VQSKFIWLLEKHDSQTNQQTHLLVEKFNIQNT